METQNTPADSTNAAAIEEAVTESATPDTAIEGVPDEDFVEKQDEERPPATVPGFDKGEFVNAIDEFRQRSEVAILFTAPNGNEYILTPFDAWTFRQNRAAKVTYEMIEKKIGDVRKYMQGKGLGVQTFMSMLDDETLWCQFFHMLYVPKEIRKYDPEHAERVKEDMLDLDNKHAIGAVYHFFMSCASFIPSAILIFFQQNPMLNMMMNTILEEARKNPFVGVRMSDSPTS